jgi:hypothetical protein
MGRTSAIVPLFNSISTVSGKGEVSIISPFLKVLALASIAGTNILQGFAPRSTETIPTPISRFMPAHTGNFSV